jgi:polycomb group RING finger protein 3
MGEDDNSGVVMVAAREINEHLTCGICRGYFRNAHTVKECLHTFCKGPCFSTLREE